MTMLEIDPQCVKAQIKSTNIVSNYPMITNLATRNVSSKFVLNSYTKNTLWFTGEELEIDPQKTIIIHPGSSYLKIGLASDAFPLVIPHVIAKKGDLRKELNIENYAEDLVTEDTAEIEEIEEIIKSRLLASKKRIIPNIHNQVVSYNKHAKRELIPDHNDAFKVEWIKPRPFGFGEDAFLLNPELGYSLYYPIRRNRFNSVDYSSLISVKDDLERIWKWAIHEKMKLQTVKDYMAVLVIPDMYHKNQVQVMIDCLADIGFRGFSLIQESVAATFGSGISAACVVNIGSQSTTVSCVEEGACIPSSRLSLDYGGDDITSFLLAILKDSCYPQHESHIKNCSDFQLINSFKERVCTLIPDDVALRLYEICARSPGKPTFMYQFKLYDEPTIAAMSLVFPSLFRKIPNPFALEYPILSRAVLNSPVDYDYEAYIEEKRKDKSTEKDPEEPERKDNENVESDPKEIEVNETLDEKEVEPNQHLVDYEEKVFDCRYNSCKESAVGISSFMKHLEIHLEDFKGLFTWNHEQFNLPSKASVSCFVLKQFIENPDLSMEVEQSNLETSQLLALDEAILKSIEAISWTPNIVSERMKRFFSNILIVGGSSKFPGLCSFMNERILHQLEVKGYESGTVVECLDRSKDLDLSYIVWKGGSVFAKLDSLKEHWIQTEEWRDIRGKALQARCIFPWQ